LKVLLLTTYRQIRWNFDFDIPWRRRSRQSDNGVCTVPLYSAVDFCTEKLMVTWGYQVPTRNYA